MQECIATTVCYIFLCIIKFNRSVFRDQLQVEINVSRQFYLPFLPERDPAPVMRKPGWHFMEREEKEDQFCWVAMNTGYQEKKLIQRYLQSTLTTWSMMYSHQVYRLGIFRSHDQIADF